MHLRKRDQFIVWDPHVDLHFWFKDLHNWRSLNELWRYLLLNHVFFSPLAIYATCTCNRLLSNTHTHSVSAKTLKAMPARGPAKSKSHKSNAGLNSRNQCNSHKLLPVQQDLQMLQLPVHRLYCQPGAEDLLISRRLVTHTTTKVSNL